MDAELLTAAFAPITRYISTLDLSRTDAAMRDLTETFPVAGIARLRRAVMTGIEAGWLTPRESAPGMRFGRLAKPTEATWGQSIDVVDMEGIGLGHLHPNGEVSLCFAVDGDPRFMGHPEGWVVVAPGSHHIPEVTGGRMVIVYFLPEGKMEWDLVPSA